MCIATMSPRKRGINFRLGKTGLRLVLLILACFIGLFVAATMALDLIPPKSIRMAAGNPGSAYHEIALRYRDLLAKDDIALEIVESAGSVENAAWLARGDDPVDVALIQGGIPIAAEADVSALGAVFLEPLLMFSRANIENADDPSQWQGVRAAIGAKGSGTRFVVEEVLAALKLDPPSEALVALSGRDAAAALLAGEVDVAVFVAPVTAPYLTALYDAPEIALASIRDLEAIRRRMAFVVDANIPRSGIDYASEKPPETVDLIALPAQLVAQAGLHPALVDRLVKAARQIHAGRDLVSGEGAYPSSASTTVPMNKQAKTLLDAPPSRLDRFVPYWMAAQINKMALLLLPLIFLLLPLFRILPGIYAWTMRARVYSNYSELVDIEKAAYAAMGHSEIDALGQRLDAVQHNLTEMRLPERYRENAYTMQMHIELVRNRLAERRTQSGAA